MVEQTEISDLLSLSARLGRDPLLVQASSGNTSIKLDGILWIKASGKWLAHAGEEEMLVPVNLEDLRSGMRNDSGTLMGAAVGRNELRASIETAMHGVLPYAVVVHIHSVNTIALAVRSDGEQRIAERLTGIDWCWIPYVASGLPLARKVEQALKETPGARVFVLANHGLVVCGSDCEETERLLAEVERRMLLPVRISGNCDCSIHKVMDQLPGWGLPEAPELHALGIDKVSRRILKGGILYPCQVMFLGPKVLCLPDPGEDQESAAFGLVEGRGVVTSRTMNESQRAVLHGLLQVVQRIEADAPIRYLSQTEVVDLLTEDAHGYQVCSEKNAVRHTNLH